MHLEVGAPPKVVAQVPVAVTPLLVRGKLALPIVVAGHMGTVRKWLVHN